MRPLTIVTSLLIISLLTSCKSTFNAKATVNQTKDDVQFDEEWHNYLSRSKADIQSSVKSILTYEIITSIRKSGIDIDLSEEEYNRLDYIPIEVYVIDSASFMSWDTCAAPASIMKLKKDEASCFVAKKGQTLFDVRMRNDYNSWEVRGFSGFGDALSNKFNVLSNRNIRVFKVYYDLVTTQNDSHNNSNYFVYQKKGKLMVLRNNQEDGDFATILKDKFRFNTSGNVPDYMQEIKEFLKKNKQ